MKFIHTIYNGYDFESNIITTTLSWSEFNLKIRNALEWSPVTYKDIDAKGQNFNTEYILPFLVNYVVLQNDDFHIMIECWRQESKYREIIMFYLVQEN